MSHEEDAAVHPFGFIYGPSLLVALHRVLFIQHVSPPLPVREGGPWYELHFDTGQMVKIGADQPAYVELREVLSDYRRWNEFAVMMDDMAEEQEEDAT